MRNELLLNEFFKQNPRFAVAFSGGVDSSYLLCAADAAGCDVHAYFIKSEFQPQFELEEAISFAKSLDVPLTVETMSILNEHDVICNSSGRCFHCKSRILERLRMLMLEDGFTVLCDGTNADDDESDRPGMKALKEQGVISPLRDCGLGKKEIRLLSKKAGLLTFDKPAYACLATRIPIGTVITKDLLERVERAEGSLFDMGFSDFRVRLMPPDTAMVQMHKDQWEKAAKQRIEIVKALESDFVSILLDMEARG